METLILASASPRRSRILAGLGAVFRVEPTDAPEVSDPSDPIGTVAANALAKAAACRRLHPAAPVLAADTLVWFEGRLVGKPSGLDEAARFLRAFSGRIQTVYTGLAFDWPGRPPDVRVEASSVRFKVLDEGLIRSYLEKTRPLDRAGAYDIDENGGLLIAGHSGSYTNIMGLPAAPVRDWLLANGLIG